MTQDRPAYSGELTRLLHAWGEMGDRGALEELLRRAMPELRKMARGRLRHERRGHTLQSLDLVDAAWLRMSPQMKRGWEGRNHFYAVFSQAMYQVLLDEAKRRHAAKRAGSRVPLEEAWVVTSGGVDVDMMDFAMALSRLAEWAPRAAEVAKLRHLSGMTEHEIAGTLEWEGQRLSVSTLRRDLKLAKGYLYRALGGKAPSDSAEE